MRQYSIDHDTQAFEAYAMHNGVDVHAPGVVLSKLRFLAGVKVEQIGSKQAWILTRKCAYFIAGESCERGTFLYKKVPTRTRTNTLPHRFFVFTWDGVKNYVADGWKAWRVRFDDQDKAVEEEYNMRENTMVNTCIEGSTVWMEPGEANDKIIREWFSDAELEPMEPEVTARMFHPAYTA